MDGLEPNEINEVKATKTASTSEGLAEARKGSWKWFWLVAMILFVLSFVLLFFGYDWIKWSTLRSINDDLCIEQLKRISLALDAYHGDHGCLPPLYLEDDAGNPAHSWRVLILPYLNGEDFYARYDFSEPWNGPHNMALVRHYPSIADNFRCPSDEANNNGETDYFAINWPDAVQDPHNIPTGDSAGHGNAPRVQYPIVEIRESGIHWMEPRDLSRDEVIRGLVSRSPHEGRSHFVTSGSTWHVLERWRIILSGEESDWLREWPARWVPREEIAD